MDGGAWWAAVHGIGKSRTRLSDFTFTFHFHALEKETAPHSSVLAWRIPGTGEPGGLPSLGSHRVRHDWSNLAVVAEFHLEDEKVLEVNGNNCCITVSMFLIPLKNDQDDKFYMCFTTVKKIPSSPVVSSVKDDSPAQSHNCCLSRLRFGRFWLLK